MMTARIAAMTAIVLSLGFVGIAPASAGSEVIRETVYVRSSVDTDADGQRDRIAVEVVRPRSTARGERVAAIMTATPYTTTRPLLSGWYDDYFVPHGYAFVEVAIQGTGRSDGCPTIGGRPDTASVAAAIGWLTGRVTGTDASGHSVRATWSLGRVGMVGLSYDGSLANAAAAADIPGLRTIVPIAGISSWYDYARDHGIGYDGALGTRYPEYQALRVVSPAMRERCLDMITELGDRAADDTYDYTPSWHERNYRVDAHRVDVPVLIAHGLSDPKLRTSQFARWWADLGEAGVPRKLWLHAGDHVEPDQIDSARWRSTLHRWMDHWLYGVDNGIMAEPRVDIQRPDSAWESYDRWPQPGSRAQRLWLTAGGLASRPAPRGATERFTDGESQLAFSAEPTEQPLRLSGTPRLEVTISADRTGTPLTALLVAYGPGVRPTVLTRGSIDTQNRYSLSQAVPLDPGRDYQVSWTLHPLDVVVPAGHHLGLVLRANDPGMIVPDPAGATVTVQLRRSSMTLPIVSS